MLKISLKKYCGLVPHIKKYFFTFLALPLSFSYSTDEVEVSGRSGTFTVTVLLNGRRVTFENLPLDTSSEAQQFGLDTRAFEWLAASPTELAQKYSAYAGDLINRFIKDSEKRQIIVLRFLMGSGVDVVAVGPKYIQVSDRGSRALTHDEFLQRYFAPLLVVLSALRQETDKKNSKTFSNFLSEPSIKPLAAPKTFPTLYPFILRNTFWGAGLLRKSLPT